MTEPLQILYVCSGNQCRSPFAQGYTTKIGDPAKVLAESAGTLDLPAAPADAKTREVALEGYAVDLRPHRSRFVGGLNLDAFDLIFGFDQQHAADLVVHHGADPGRVFLLGERVVTPHKSHTQPLREAIAAAHAARSGLTWNPDLPIPDPIGRSKKIHVRTAKTIAERLDALLTSFGAIKGA